MHDPFHTRDWADHHANMSDSIDAAIEKLAFTFRRLTARLYEAPWQADPNASRRESC